MRACVLVVAACSSSSSPPAPPAPTADLAVVDVTVVPMTGDGELRHQTVLVTGDKITAIEPAGTPVSATRTIDGHGTWLMPGLADMHVHAWHEDELTMFVAAGVTTIRNMWGVPLHVTWRGQIAAGTRFGPTIVTAGNLIDGDPPLWAGSTLLVKPADADAIVKTQLDAGFDFIKVVNRVPKDAYDELVASATARATVVAGHVPYAAGLEGVLAAHQHSIEHLDGYFQALVPAGVKIPPLDDADAWTHTILTNADLARLPDLVAHTKISGAWNCPTLVGNDRDPKLYDVPAIAKRVHWLDLVPALVRARWAVDFAADHGTPEQADESRRANKLAMTIAAALAKADAPILVGTDSGVPYVVAGEGLHDEIELLVEAGIPRPRVMRAATADAWRYLGHPGDVGIVKVGARADLLVVASDPMTTPLPLVPEGVVLRGTWLAKADLETRLATIRARATETDPLRDDTTLETAVHFVRALDGTDVGVERVVTRGAIVTAAVADPASDVDATITLAPDGGSIDAHYHTFDLDLRVVRTATGVDVAGRDWSRRKLALHADLPRDGVLAAPGLAGIVALALATRGKTDVTAVELTYYPTVALVPHHYKVANKPGGRQAVVLTEGKTSLEIGTDFAPNAEIPVTGAVMDRWRWHR